MSDYNEDHYEQTLIQLFTERLGYNDIGDRYNDISMVCEDHAFFV